MNNFNRERKYIETRALIRDFTKDDNCGLENNFLIIPRIFLQKQITFKMIQDDRVCVCKMISNNSQDMSAMYVASQEKFDTTNESGLRHIVTSVNWAPKHKEQTKRNTMYGTELTKTNLLKLLPCVILLSNSPYLISYHFSGKTNIVARGYI